MESSADVQTDFQNNNCQGKLCSALAWFAIGTLLFFVSAAAVLKMVDVKIDYPAHIRIASGITWESLRHPVSFLKVNCYPVWHILTWLAMNAFGCSGRLAAAVVTGGCVVGTWSCAALYFSKRHRGEEKDIAWAACVFLMLVMPIWIPSLQLSLGQGGPNVLHNPTNVMVKLLTVPCFLLYAKIMGGIGKEPTSRICVFKLVALSLLVVLSALSKPSFVQIFIPAMLVLAVFKLVKYRKAAIGPILAVGISFVPVFFLVTLQTRVSFYGGGGSGIAISFLKVWRYYCPNCFESMMRAVLFPLIVLLWGIRVRRVSTADALAWIMYGVALAECTLLVEKGDRWWHGNLFWAYNLAQFCIWFVSIESFIFLARGYVRKTGGIEPRLWLCSAAVAGLLHLASGLCYLWRVIVLGIWR